MQRYKIYLYTLLFLAKNEEIVVIKARGHEAEVKSQKAWDGRLETEVERHESEVRLFFNRKERKVLRKGHRIRSQKT